MRTRGKNWTARRLAGSDDRRCSNARLTRLRANRLRAASEVQPLAGPPGRQLGASPERPDDLEERVGHELGDARADALEQEHEHAPASPSRIASQSATRGREGPSRPGPPRPAAWRTAGAARAAGGRSTSRRSTPGSSGSRRRPPTTTSTRPRRPRTGLAGTRRHQPARRKQEDRGVEEEPAIPAPEQRADEAPVGRPQAERVLAVVDPGEDRRGVVEVAHVPGRAEREQVVAEQDQRRNRRADREQGQRVGPAACRPGTGPAGRGRGSPRPARPGARSPPRRPPGSRPRRGATESRPAAPVPEQRERGRAGRTPRAGGRRPASRRRRRASPGRRPGRPARPVAGRSPGRAPGPSGARPSGR